MMTISWAINGVCDGAQYKGLAVDEASYNKLEWCDKRPKPSWQDVSTFASTKTMADIPLAAPDPFTALADRVLALEKKFKALEDAAR